MLVIHNDEGPYLQIGRVSQGIYRTYHLRENPEVRNIDILICKPQRSKPTFVGGRKTDTPWFFGTGYRFMGLSWNNYASGDVSGSIAAIPSYPPATPTDTWPTFRSPAIMPETALPMKWHIDDANDNVIETYRLHRVAFGDGYLLCLSSITPDGRCNATVVSAYVGGKMGYVSPASHGFRDLSQTIDDSASWYSFVLTTSFKAATQITWDAAGRNINPEAIAQRVNAEIRVNPPFGDFSTNNWSDLAREALQDIGTFGGNGVAYVSEYIKMYESVRGTLDAIKGIKDLDPKAFASLYLSNHYGWELTAQDTREIREFLMSNPKRVSRAKAVDSFVYKEYRVRKSIEYYYDTASYMGDLLDQVTHQLDLGLNAKNLWDMVPFSFVVDWFTDLGDQITALTNYAELLTKYDIICCGRSVLTQWTRPATYYGTYLVGSAEFYSYKRIYGEPIQPTWHPPLKDPKVLTEQHWLEASTLYISMK